MSRGSPAERSLSAPSLVGGVVASTLAMLLVACLRDPPPTPLRVELGGCVEWRRGGTCVLGDEPLVLWVADHAPAELSVRTASGAVVPRTSVGVQAGARLELSELLGAAPARGWVEVRGREGARYTLDLEREADDGALAEARNLRRAGRRDEAEAKLTALGSRPGVTGERARLALAVGDVPRAIDAFSAAIAEAEGSDRPLAALRDRCALAHTLASRAQAHARAEAALAPLAPLAERYAGAALDLAYFRLTIAAERRDVRAGMAEVRRLAALAERLAQPASALDGEQMLTHLLVFAGRWPEAARALESLERAAARERDPCKAAELWSNLGWYRLLGHRQAPELFRGVPWSALDRAARLFGSTCPRADQLANTELNRAWGALIGEELVRAREHHAAAVAALSTLAAPDAGAQLHLLHLEAELALRDGRAADARRAFERLADEAQAREVVELRWQAAVGRAKALEAEGRAREALAAYAESEARLADLAELVPLGEARDALFFDRGEGAARGVALGLARGELDAAIALVRTSRRGALAWTRVLDAELDRARLVEVVDARDAIEASDHAAWALPADATAATAAARDARHREALATLDTLFARAQAQPTEVAARKGDEAELYAHPIARLPEFVATRSSTTSGAEVPMAVIIRRGPRTVAEPVTSLSGIRAGLPLLRGARRVRVYAHPSLEDLDWMAIRVDGRPLYETTPTVFHADLRSEPRRSATSTIRRALVMADPPGVLPGARREADRVAARLASAGMEVVRADGLDRRGLRAAWARPVELFHYSGHGVQAGLDGLEGGIPLADGGRLSTLDILTATTAPRRAVLAACDLGRRGSTRSAPGLGFAHALLLVGADEVVAAVRPVDDAATTQWTERLYTHVAGGADLEEAVRAATAELASRQDATAFRLWSAAR